jgi:hypothetical protein
MPDFACIFHNLSQDRLVLYRELPLEAGKKNVESILSTKYIEMVCMH